jgi:hypothetical protein
VGTKFGLGLAGRTTGAGCCEITGCGAGTASGGACTAMAGTCATAGVAACATGAGACAASAGACAASAGACAAGAGACATGGGTAVWTGAGGGVGGAAAATFSSGGRLFTTGAMGACPRAPTGGGLDVVLPGVSGARGAMGGCPGGRLGRAGIEDGDAARGAGGTEVDPVRAGGMDGGGAALDGAGMDADDGARGRGAAGGCVRGGVADGFGGDDAEATTGCVPELGALVETGAAVAVGGLAAGFCREVVIFSPPARLAPLARGSLHRLPPQASGRFRDQVPSLHVECRKDGEGSRLTHLVAVPRGNLARACPPFRWPRSTTRRS